MNDNAEEIAALDAEIARLVAEVAILRAALKIIDSWVTDADAPHRNLVDAAIVARNAMKEQE